MNAASTYSWYHRPCKGWAEKSYPTKKDSITAGEEHQRGCFHTTRETR